MQLVSAIIHLLEDFWDSHPGVKSAVRAAVIAIIGAILAELGIGSLLTP